MSYECVGVPAGVVDDGREIAPRLVARLDGLYELALFTEVGEELRAGRRRASARGRDGRQLVERDRGEVGESPVNGIRPRRADSEHGSAAQAARACAAWLEHDAPLRVGGHGRGFAGAQADLYEQRSEFIAIARP